MMIIQELSDMIEEELNDAEKYAECAVMQKESNPKLAETFYKLSGDELGHANLIHDQVILIIEDYRKKNGDPPEVMLKLYEVLHKKHISKMAAVKGMLALYKP